MAPPENIGKALEGDANAAGKRVEAAALKAAAAKGHFGNPTLLLTLAFKTTRTSTAWLAAFMANKAQQELYISQVYLNQSAPPSLTKMLTTYLIFHIVLSLTAMAGILALSFVLTADRKLLWMRMMVMLLDFAVELLMTTFMGLIIADILMRKQYFSYQFEGLRATRAYRELLFATTAVNALTPYFLVLPSSWKV